MNRSVLELAVGGEPFPHADPNGEWRYRHAVPQSGPTPLDHQAVTDFLAYETAHGRAVNVEAAPELSDWRDWEAPSLRPAPGSCPIQCCSHVYARGCGADLVCHGAPLDTARQIVMDGALRPATHITGRSAADLAAASSWGEPPDYFEHVMFANGRCTAPEAVALSRRVGRDLVPSDLARGYPPAVRFYFRWDELARRADARFDGVHPVKILGDVSLIDSLIAVVVHADQYDALAAAVDARLHDRVVVFDLTEPQPHEWATAAVAAAKHLT